MHNRTIIRELDITPAEQAEMTVIISKDEKRRRDAKKRWALSRDEYLRQQASHTEKQRQRAFELAEAGLSKPAIAAELGVSTRQVYKLL